MAGEIIKLGKVRKAKAKAAKETLAAANRALHGRTREQRLCEEDAKARVARELDGARRVDCDRPAGGTGGGNDDER